MVVAFHWHMNRDPTLWGKDANAFCPERFIAEDDDSKSRIIIDTDEKVNSTISPEMTKNISQSKCQKKLSVPSHFMPFQVGKTYILCY